MTEHRGAVVVSGASKGIGRAGVVELARRGYHVFAGVRAPQDGAALRDEANGHVTPLALDVTRETDVARAVDTVRDAVGPRGLWGLVNNAGIVVPGPLEFLPGNALREQFEVNVFGALALTQAFLPLLRSTRGRVVNVSSVNGRLASPFNGAYAGSKFALEGLSDALRLELGPAGVAVVVVQPGAVATPIWETSRQRAIELLARYPTEAWTHYGKVLERLQDIRVPPRAVSPERVARVVARALEARRPRTRYHVGWDARAGVLLARLLPGRALDWVFGARRSRRAIPERR
jgi:NAD(P)-dependent dehydrogenase (short-subunit alcohol dehydrogenase family)